MKKITQMFLMLFAIGAVAFGVTGCGEKSRSSSDSSSSKSEKKESADKVEKKESADKVEKKEDPKAEIEEARKVAQKFTALIGNKKSDEAEELCAENVVDSSGYTNDPFMNSKRKVDVAQFMTECDAFKKHCKAPIYNDADGSVTFNFGGMLYGSEEPIPNYVVLKKIEGKYKVTKYRFAY